jgi:uncharacterized membrane protein YedE/YeeE
MTGTAALLLAAAMGFAFGFLLHRGRMTSCDVISNQFCLRDFRVLKVLLTTIVVGGIGVLVLVDTGNAKYAVKDADLLGVVLGAVLFGIGMAVYGYCPGSGLAAIATGSVHALVGAFGMIAGAIVYALTFDWVKANVLKVWTLGKVRLPDLTGIPDAVWFSGLAVASVIFFVWVERRSMEAPAG